VRFQFGPGFSAWAFGKTSRQPNALLWTSLQQQADCAEAVAGIVPSERQHLVPLGIDFNTFGSLAGGRPQTRQNWNLRPDDIVIGTASALRPIKRLENFIDLVAELARKHENVVGILAGDAVAGEEAYRQSLLDRIHATGLGRRFQWVGNLDRVEPFDHAIDVFVSTSEYETFGNSVCEAMACRRAVAAYQGGSVQEVVGDAGFIVPTGNLSELVKAVDKLIEDASLRREIGERARQRVVEHFNPEKSFLKLTRIYRKLLADPWPISCKTSQTVVR
jgi:glycosyltransferase involved in cell wall biosynthesis